MASDEVNHRVPEGYKELQEDITSSEEFDLLAEEIYNITRQLDDILQPIPSCLRRCSHQVVEIDKESQPIIDHSHKVPEIHEDGILCSMVSPLRMRDAVRTSILSKRWRNIWTYIPNLIFNAFNMLEVDPVSNSSFFHLSSAEQKATLRTRRKKFITSVCEFLRHHQGSGVKRFTVSFQLSKKHAYHLDKWVDFAIGSGAKELQLSLHEPMLEYSSTTVQYDFPFHLFDYGRGSSIETLGLAYCNLNPHATFTGFSSLKTLSLGCTYMTDVQFEVLLSYCFVIESLCIYQCQGLINLNISHQSGRLKMLYVYECPALMWIELDSACLTLFVYQGDWMPLRVKHASQVANAKIIVEDIDFSVESYLTRLAGDLPHLEALMLCYPGPAEVGIISNSFKLTHLQRLFLSIALSQKFDALGLVYFLKASPLLEKFHVTISGGNESLKGSEGGLCIQDSTHSKLRQFELFGFSGRKDEMELVLYVLRNAAALELVTVDPSVWVYCVLRGPIEKHSLSWRALNPSEATHLDAYRQLSGVAQSSRAKLVLR